MLLTEATTGLDAGYVRAVKRAISLSDEYCGILPQKQESCGASRVRSASGGAAGAKRQNRVEALIYYDKTNAKVSVTNPSSAARPFGDGAPLSPRPSLPRLWQTFLDIGSVRHTD